MSVAASITWIVTALLGATLLSIWLIRGGLRQQQGAGASPVAVIGLHGLLALTTLVLVSLTVLGVGRLSAS
jgi:hypothetical protein